MRIGILTLHSGANYGGTLQCVALYSVLKEMGNDVEVIDFTPTQIAPIHKRFLYNLTCCRSWSDIVEFASRSLYNKGIRHSVNKNLVEVFDSFRQKKLTFSPKVNEQTISLLNDRYDCIVVGSDQVWSSFVRDKLTYWGDWNPKYNGRLVSYAACATSDEYPMIRRGFMQNLLKRFNAISVRDRITQSLVEKLTKQEVPVVLDPTFLYGFDEFVSESLYSQPYIFVYVLGAEIKGGNDAALDIVKKKIGTPCQVIAATTYDDDIAYADITLKNISPDVWVNLIAHAQFVFTDSFHGSVFSIKNKTPFVAYYAEKSRASRLLDLQAEYCDKKVVVNSISDLKSLRLEPIDCDAVNEMQKKSLSYLKMNC